MTSHKIGKVAGKRALAALMTTAIATTGFAVVGTPAAFAIDAPASNKSQLGHTPKPANNGNGTVNTVGTVKPGGILSITGTGFNDRGADGLVSFLLEDGQVDSPVQAGTGANTEGEGRNVDLPRSVWTDANNFTAKIKLPDDLVPGYYFFRVLAGNDGSSAGAVSKAVWFEVSDKEIESTAAVSATGATGTSVAVAGTGFTANSVVSATVNGNAVKFSAGRRAVDTTNADAEGAVNGTLNFAEGTVPATTEGTIELKDAAGKSATTKFVGAASTAIATSNEDGSGTGRAPGTNGNYTLGNLPEGAQLTYVGTDKENWLTTPVAASKGTAVAEKVAVPETAQPGTPIVFKYTVGGKEYTQDSGQVVAPSEDAKGAENFTINQADLKSGLYQSVYSAKENALYVTRSVGRPPVKESSIFKLNADTLEVIKEINPAVQNEETGARWAAYGVGLDEKNGVLWVTNSRQNTVAAYKASDLSLIKQFDADATSHPRDVVVDQTTGKAYVSSSAGGNRIDVFTVDGGKVETINLPQVASSMSLSLDQKTGELFTVDLNSPTVAKIDVRSNNAVTTWSLEGSAASPSGVAYDPENRNIFIANQGTNNVLVFNVDKQKVIKDIPVGGGALNVAYEPVNKLVVTANRTGGTATIIDAKSLDVTANINVGKFANHVSVDGRGNIYVVNKAGVKKDDVSYDQVYKITPKASKPKPAGSLISGSDVSGSDTTGSNTAGSNIAGSSIAGSNTSGSSKGAGTLLGILAGVGLLGGALASLFNLAVHNNLIDRNTLPAFIRQLLGV